MSNSKRMGIAAALVLAAGLTKVAVAAYASRPDPSSGGAVEPPVVGRPAGAPAAFTFQGGKRVSVPGQSEHSGTPGYQTRDTVIPDGATPEEIQQLLSRPW